jgi:hypothetical protein
MPPSYTMLFSTLRGGSILDRCIHVSNSWFIYGTCMDGIDVKMHTLCGDVGIIRLRAI